LAKLWTLARPRLQSPKTKEEKRKRRGREEGNRREQKE
jgi:hypothetical protein